MPKVLLCCITVTFYLVSARAADVNPIVQVTNATSYDFDKFCTCTAIANNSGKDIAIPHKSAAEVNAFLTSLPRASITNAGACTSFSMGPATFNNYPAISTTDCYAKSETRFVGSIESTGGHSVDFMLSNTSFCTTCQCRYRLNYGVWTIVNWKDSIPVCQNDVLEFDFSCPNGTHSTDVDLGTETFNVSINTALGCF